MKKAFGEYLFIFIIYYLYSSQVVSVFWKLIISIDMCLLLLYLSLLSLLSTYFNLS